MNEVKEAGLLVAAILMAIYFGHYLVRKILAFAGYGGPHEKAAMWIGFLERALVSMFAFLGMGAATVFIFAVKVGIMSYRILPTDSDKKRTSEYMLIGTMTSYFMGMVFGYFGLFLKKILI
jgi:hypothetical protein